MNPTRCLIIGALTIFSFALNSYATPTERTNDHSIAFQLDNDLFGNTDENYTNGWRLSYLRPQNSGKKSTLQNVLNTATGSTHSNSPFDRLSTLDAKDALEWDLSLSATQLIYTPADLDAPTAPEGEHPYVGWLGFMVAAHAKGENSISSAGIAIGWTGENSFAQEAQDIVHDARNIARFNGWDSQYPTEITVNLHLDRKSRYPFLNSEPNENQLHMDAHFDYGLALGNFRTAAYLGTLARIGFNLPSTNPAPRIDSSTPSHKLFVSDEQRTGWSVYVFGAVRGHAVLHDITLDGPLFRDADNAVNSTPWVGELVYGVGTQLHDWELIYSKTIRSDEFEGQSEDHNFGSVIVRYNF